MIAGCRTSSTCALGFVVVCTQADRRKGDTWTRATPVNPSTRIGAAVRLVPESCSRYQHEHGAEDECIRRWAD
jgi:hypothetical protein